MTRTFLLILTFFVFFYSWGGAGVYVKNNGHFSEFILSGMADSIVSVSEGGDSLIMVELVTPPLAADTASKFNDPFIKSISIDGHMLTVNFYKDTDYTLSKRNGDILITAARVKKSENIELGYGIEKPVLKALIKYWKTPKLTKY